MAENFQHVELDFGHSELYNVLSNELVLKKV